MTARNRVKELDIERYLVKRVAELGGTAYKFSSPSRANVPDRIVVLPGGVIAFVELKAPDITPREAQLRELDRLTKLGAHATWINNLKAVDTLLKALTQ
jgi:Holliday junction resolvase